MCMCGSDGGGWGSEKEKERERSRERKREREREREERDTLFTCMVSKSIVINCKILSSPVAVSRTESAQTLQRRRRSECCIAKGPLSCTVSSAMATSRESGGDGIR